MLLDSLFLVLDVLLGSIPSQLVEDLGCLLVKCHDAFLQLRLEYSRLLDELILVR